MEPLANRLSPQAGEGANESLREFHVNDPGAPTILIIDDTPSNLGLVVNLFEDSGYRVSIAQDGEEGFQRAQLVQPDLILLDVMMPGADGFETCRQLKAQEATRDIPVIFMTSLASVEHKVKGFGAGAVDYLTKPLQIEEVMARVGTHLKLHAAQKKLAEHNEELERRVAERTAELAAREREFRTLVENAPDEIARHDRQGRFFYINPQHEKTLGVTLADLMGKTPMECFPGIPDVVAYQARLMEVIETGRTAEYEATLADIGGGFRYHSILLVAERGAEGEIVGVLAIGRDITELKLADAAVRERELHYRLLFENSPISIWEEDFSAVHSYFDELRQAGVENLAAHLDAHPEAVGHCAELVRIVDVNRAAVALHQAQNKSELFAGLAQTFTPDSFRAFREELIGLWRGETEMKLDAVVQTLAGEPRHVGVHFSIAPDTGPPWSKVLVSLVDITERKRAERELHLLNRALDHAFDATYLIGEDLRIRYVNDAAVRALGYSREELLSMTLLDIDPNVTREMMRDVMRLTAEGGGVSPTMESTHRRKDGSIFPIEVGATIFSYEGEKLHLTTVRDITERKKAESILHEQEQAIRAVVENSPDTIIRYDSQCRRIYHNPAMEKIFGQPRAQLLDTSPSDFSPLPEEYVATIRRTLETGTEQRMESWFRDVEGEMRWVDLRLAPEFDADGKVATVLAIGRDITERKRAEEELAAREREFRTLAENIPDNIIRYDRNAKKKYVNTATARSMGVKPEELLNQTPEETPENVRAMKIDEFSRRVHLVLETGEPEEMEVTLRHAEKGEQVHNVRFVAEHDEQGEIVGALMVGRDITELKKAERALEESREQLRGLTARREAAREEERKYIAREVHDELGQILTGLQLNVSVLKHKFAADTPEIGEKLKETMALTDRALAVARNVASALRPAALDMGIASALEWLGGRFGTNTGIECEVHVGDADIELEEGQAIALFRIVQESLTNVARHASASRIVIDLGREGNDYVLKVRDNGKGFDWKNRKQDSFGLVGMRERALLLGGEVVINSKPGEGTEVEVRIPAHNVSRLS